MTYAIRNKRTKKWVYGTWKQSGRTVQRTSHDMCMTFDSYENAKLEMMLRKCGKDYEIVPVMIVARGEE